MDEIRSLKLRWLHGQLLGVVERQQVTTFAHWPGAVWSPAVNAYRCDRGLKVCVDLAGVGNSEIEVTLTDDRLLVIRGTRTSPEPTGSEERTLQVLALEIDSGPFERKLRLPREVEADQVTANQENGLLWINLPFRS